MGLIQDVPSCKELVERNRARAEEMISRQARQRNRG